MPHLLTDVTRTMTERLEVEFNHNANKLRIADAGGNLVAIYSNGEVYRVQAEAPAGCVVIPEDPRLPHLVDSLVHAKIVERVSYRVDRIGPSTTLYETVRVLI